MAHTTADKLQYILEAKELIRQAIISMGVAVPTNTPLKEYATKILAISSDANATAEDLFLNKTAYVQGSKITGTFDVMNTTIPEIGGSLTETEALADEILGEDEEE